MMSKHLKYIFYLFSKSLGVIIAKLRQAAVSVKSYSVMVKLRVVVPAGLSPGSPPWLAVRRGAMDTNSDSCRKICFVFSLLISPF